MVAAFDYCLHGRAARPRRSTPPCTASSTPPHVDHLHPDSGHRHRDRGRRRGADQARSSATRSSGSRGADPASSSGLDIAARSSRTNPQAIGCILGGHGITAWGDTCEEAEAQLAVDHRHRGRVHRGARQARTRSARVIAGYEALPERASAARRPPRWLPRSVASPRPTSPRSGTSPTRSRCWTSWPAPSTRGWPRWAPAARTTSCAPRSSRMVLDLPADGPGRGVHRPAAGAARGLPRGLPRATTSATRRRTPRRSAAPTRSSCSCPASACSASAPTSRPHASPASSTSTPST